jgi:hypothetical protein
MTESPPDDGAPSAGRPSSRISSRGPELALAALLLAAAALVIVDSLRVGHRWASDGPQSGYFPFFIGLALAFSAGAVVVDVLRRWKALGEDTFLDATQARSVAAVLVPTALYLGSMHWVGLLAGSAVLIAWFMKRHGGFGWGLTALIALGVPTLVHLVFERGFLVLLPRGVWVEALLTRLGAG